MKNERDMDPDELIELIESATSIEEVIATLEKYGMIIDVQDLDNEFANEMPGKYDTIH